MQRILKSMAFYQTRGKIPQKKHTTFYSPDKKLYWEELFSSKGFSGIYSTKYHLHEPPKLLKIEKVDHCFGTTWDKAHLQPYHFLTDRIQCSGTIDLGRKTFLKNTDITIQTARITENTDIFYKNSGAHELLFFHYGSGVYRSEYGSLPLKEGDYLVIPKGTIGQFNFDDVSKVKLLIVESQDPFAIPSHFKNEYGQILEYAPYSERDFITPSFESPIDQKGSYQLKIKMRDDLYDYHIPYHPFDLVGWDGYYYPFTFNINDYSPMVGKIHLPPPVHVVFITPYCVICNFVPRLYDFHENAIPAPYFHSNIDSDEVIYYVNGNFMSRKGISEGSITLHPSGIPHGPQPGKIEQAIGKKDVFEYAVMIDTFKPLNLTEHVKESMDPNYFQSWL